MRAAMGIDGVVLAAMPREMVFASAGMSFDRGSAPSHERAMAAIARGAELVRAAGGRGAIRADASATNADTLARISAAVETMKTEQAGKIAKLEAHVAGMEAHIDAEAARTAGAMLNGGGSGIAPDPEYTTAFASYTRRGATDAEAALKTANATGERASIQAAMSEGTVPAAAISRRSSGIARSRRRSGRSAPCAGCPRW